MVRLCMKKQIIIIILLLITKSAFSEIPKWEFKIELSKENYLLEENIWLDVTITNITTDTLVSARRITSRGLGFTFIVADSLGNNVDYTGSYSTASYSPKVYLVAPGEELYRCYNLGHLFSTLPYTTGSYTIQSFIDLPFENECYFDDLTSNALSFNIVEPIGIEKEAYKLKLEACDRFIYCTSPEAVQIYQQLFEKFPNSVYAEEAFRAIKREYIIERFNQRNKEFDYVETANKILFQYPNSGDSKNRLSSIFDIDERRDRAEKLVGKEKKRFLNDIIRVVPNTRLAKFAKQILQRDSRIEVFDKCESVIDTIPKWELKIELSKEKYFLFEPIWLDVTITNITKDTLKSDCDLYPNSKGFQLIITDSTGNQLAYSCDWTFCPTVNSNRTHLIPPGEKIYKCFNLLNFYHTSPSSFPLTPYYQAIQTGKYSVQAKNIKHYYNPYIFDNLTSNVLFFDILKLDETENAVYNLILEAGKLRRQKDHDPAGRKYQEILDRYPNSVFSENCYYYTQTYIDNAYREGKLDHDKLLRNMLDKFPNSSDSRGRILGIVYDFDLEKKLEFLKTVIADHPNTRAAKFAKQMFLRDSRKQVPK